jgi:CheY-like chemotaxis protein
MLFGEEPEDSRRVEAEPAFISEPENETEPAPVAETDVQEQGPMEAMVESAWPLPTESAPAEAPALDEPAEQAALGSARSEDLWGVEPDRSIQTAPEPALSEAAPPAGEPEAQRADAGTVVIIEDDQAVASYYAALFKGNGYKVEVANDGVSGVDLCIRVQPDVILLDVMMPKQNGILVLQTLRASDETRNTPVVVLSNFSEPTLIKRALQIGALEYVIKTQVEGPALLEAVPRWMRREKAFAAA